MFTLLIFKGHLFPCPAALQWLFSQAPFLKNADHLLTIGLMLVFSLTWRLSPVLGCIPKQPESNKPSSWHAREVLQALHHSRALLELSSKIQLLTDIILQYRL